MAAYVFSKSEIMQISTSGTACEQFRKIMKLKLCNQYLSRHQVPSKNKVLRLVLGQQLRVKMVENLHLIQFILETSSVTHYLFYI